MQALHPGDRLRTFCRRWVLNRGAKSRVFDPSAVRWLAPQLCLPVALEGLLAEISASQIQAGDIMADRIEKLVSSSGRILDKTVSSLTGGWADKRAMMNVGTWIAIEASRWQSRSRTHTDDTNTE